MTHIDEDPDANGDSTLSNDGDLHGGEDTDPEPIEDEPDSERLLIDSVSKDDVVSALPRSLQVLAALSVTGAGYLVAFANDPVGAIQDIIEEIIFQSVLEPAANAVWDSGVALASSLITLTLGSDGVVGLTPGSTVGFSDIPLVLIQQLETGIISTADSIVTVVDGFNHGVAGTVTQFGLAAPPIVTFLWTLELGVFLYSVYVLAVALSRVPVVSVLAGGGAAMSVLPRRIYGAIFK